MQRPKMGFTPNLGLYKHYNYSKHKARFIYKKRWMRSMWFSTRCIHAIHPFFTLSFNYSGITTIVRNGKPTIGLVRAGATGVSVISVIKARAIGYSYYVTRICMSLLACYVLSY